MKSRLVKVHVLVKFVWARGIIVVVTQVRYDGCIGTGQNADHLIEWLMTVELCQVRDTLVFR